MINDIKKIFAILFISYLLGNDSDFLSKATLAIKNKKYKEALMHINKAEDSNQKNPDFFRLKALLYEMLGEPDLAKKAWKRCYKFSGNANMKREAKIHIQNLTNN